MRPARREMAMCRAMITAMMLSGAIALPACATSDPGSGLAALAPEGNAATAATTDPQAADTTQATGNPATPQQVAALPGNVKISFSPVIGATTAAVEPLSRELAARAKARGILVVPEAGLKEGYLLKGYFSTIDEGGGTTVIYVWDVVGQAGKRLHRIQGQMKVENGRGNGWDDVDERTMQTIADITIDALAAWLAGGAQTAQG